MTLAMGNGIAKTVGQPFDDAFGSGQPFDGAFARSSLMLSGQKIPSSFRYQLSSLRLVEYSIWRDSWLI